ncbi:hypothetical protein CEUSTIGMA_g8014.t1 [Chlamydomonas eustigma]|uniref:Uncharacterized protein n=1 Tax=Chlamydomonas eustigma TaxID=1157962 RepID=A0A250XBW1_9CHLO|nr:hypothetical protein CEUSTIGMA_g8014.t1 [Chlamydomonas eustigma]|eukprot:GAX80577.1 hypothetical protein CEUSTIGMA_g8014.t1 [Chlamydomonas eustigma]
MKVVQVLQDAEYGSGCDPPGGPEFKEREVERVWEDWEEDLAMEGGREEEMEKEEKENVVVEADLVVEFNLLRTRTYRVVDADEEVGEGGVDVVALV